MLYQGGWETAANQGGEQKPQGDLVKLEKVEAAPSKGSIPLARGFWGEGPKRALGSHLDRPREQPPVQEDLSSDLFYGKCLSDGQRKERQSGSPERGQRLNLLPNGVVPAPTNTDTM